jgi:putative transposase
VPHDIRDRVMDFVTHWSVKAELPPRCFIGWLGIATSKFYAWRWRYGQVNEHNGGVPRDFWLEPWEKEAIVAFHREYPLEGYRRLAFMMLDRDIVAVSPSSAYRVLRDASLLRKWNHTFSGKGKGFMQPLLPHEHWHVDISYLNIGGTFYYLGSVRDSYSRYVVHWDIRAAMTAADIKIVLQRAREKFPQTSPRIISDNGPQFMARDFKAFIRLGSMTHVTISPHYPPTQRHRVYHPPGQVGGTSPADLCRTRSKA